MTPNLILHHNFRIENAVESEKFLNIDGYACHWNVRNLNDEIVDSNSFDKFFQMYEEGKLKPALNFNHGELIIGGIDTIERRDEGLYISCHLNKDVRECRDTIIPNILANDISGFSTEGYVVDGIDGVDFNDDGSYYVRNFLLTAVAVVSTPADWDARFTVRNYLNENPNLLKTNKKEEKSFNPLLFL